MVLSDQRKITEWAQMKLQALELDGVPYAREQLLPDQPHDLRAALANEFLKLIHT